jgi:phenylpropionate dioxygenase-like ring-hydroxylating dioxygenase large terminal subunit
MSEPRSGYIPDAWFVACRSHALKRQPLAVTLQNTPVVLFRDASNAARAFTDRCPHRNAPLSLGRVVDGSLQCAYHGWRFSHDGQCLEVPGLVDGPAALKSRCAETWATFEGDGFIWVYSTANVAPSGEPFRFPHLTTPGYSTVYRSYSVEASLYAVVENTLDVPHTAYLHGGLFRTAKKQNTIEVIVRRDKLKAEAEFIGEPAPRGLAGRILAPGGGVVKHSDRFFSPCIAQVEYQLSPKAHLFANTAVTPTKTGHCQLFTCVTFRLPVPHFLVRPFVTPVAASIFAQDAVMLRKQQATVEHFGGEKFVSSELDVLGPQIARLLKEARGEVSASETLHEHRIQMRT